MGLTPEQKQLYQEIINIVSDYRLSPVEMYDLLDPYWGLDPIIDDTVSAFQESALGIMVAQVHLRGNL